jgi:hypothetical protein
MVRNRRLVKELRVYCTIFRRKLGPEPGQWDEVERRDF